MDLGTIVAEFTAKRVTAPDATETTRYRDVIKAYTFLGQRDTVLDLLVQGSTIGIHLNGVLITTVHLTASIEAGEIPGSYVSEPFPGAGFHITTVAGHTFDSTAQTQGKQKMELPPGLKDIETHKLKGTIQDGVYTHETRSVTLFTAADGAYIHFTGTDTTLIPTANVYGRITPKGISTGERRRFQNKPRSIIEGTTAFYLQCDGRGNPIEPSQRGCGKKFLTPINVANLALCYLIECGYSGQK